MAMTQQERDWLDWLKRTRDGVVTQKQAAAKMGVTDRWVRELLSHWEQEGDRVVIHGLRGQPSNHQIAKEIKQKALKILQQPDWHDVGSQLASEQLAKRHKIQISKETLRVWRMEAGLWQSRPRKVEEVHCWRPRRSGYGELVQWDTSEHDWLEGRGEPVRYLVRMIDDATSRSWGRFVWHNGTRENMGVLWGYLERYGRMVDTYTDRHTMFMVPPKPGETEAEHRQADRLTQIGRGLREVGIGWIPAYSPQAKGRIERSFGTDQDRLVKQLRLAKVKTLHGANEFLENEYWPEWDARFARPLAGVTDLHRPLTAEINLAAALSHVEQRIITNDFTFPFAGQRYQIARNDVAGSMKRSPLRVELRLDGTLHARYQGRYVQIVPCGEKPPARQPSSPRPVSAKGANVDGKSSWMEGFWERPAPPLWRAIRDSNASY